MTELGVAGGVGGVCFERRDSWLVFWHCDSQRTASEFGKMDFLFEIPPIHQHLP